MAYPPTKGNRGVTVFLDPGHGGPDPGASRTTTADTTVLEKTVNLAVVDQAVPVLRNEGFRVVVSRTTDSLVLRLQPGDMSGGLLTQQGDRADLAARAGCANEAHAAVLVSVHFNAGGSVSEAGCLSVYDAVRTFWRSNLSLASDLQSSLMWALNSQGWAIPNDGITVDSNVGTPARYQHLMILGPKAAGYFTRPSTMPGALVEPLFLTDPFEATIADSSRGQSIIADALVAGIGTYLAQTGSPP